MIPSSFKINKIDHSLNNFNSSSSAINWNLPCFDVHNVISNIVGLTKINHTFDLNLVHKFWANSVFEPSKIPCVRCPLNIQLFNAVALVYSSGSIIITGLNNIQLVKFAFLILHNFFNKLFLFHSLPLFNFKIHNVVSSFNTKHHINLNALTYLNEKFFFDPQEFPAAQFHAHDFINIHATVLIYFNGKIIVTGAKFSHLGIFLGYHDSSVIQLR